MLAKQGSQMCHKIVVPRYLIVLGGKIKLLFVDRRKDVWSPDCTCHYSRQVMSKFTEIRTDLQGFSRSKLNLLYQIFTVHDLFLTHLSN